MGNGIYVAMTAATARTRELDVVADKLANTSTPGFMVDESSFQTFNGPDNAQTLGYVAAVEGGLRSAGGVPSNTGRPLDVIPQPGTFMPVSLPDGTTGYTRHGALQVDNRGNVTAGSHPLLNARLSPVVVPAGEMPTITPDGAVMVGNRVVDQLGTFVLEGPLHRASTHAVTGAAAVPAPVTQLVVGALEMPRETTLDAAVRLVGVQRQFENAMQAIQTYRRLDQAASELGRVR